MITKTLKRPSINNSPNLSNPSPSSSSKIVSPVPAPSNKTKNTATPTPTTASPTATVSTPTTNDDSGEPLNKKQKSNRSNSLSDASLSPSPLSPSSYTTTSDSLEQKKQKKTDKSTSRHTSIDNEPEDNDSDDYSDSSESQNNTRIFNCENCGKVFTRKHNLKSHLLIHTDIKPYNCKDCSKSFRRINDLKRHELLHTGEKPFKCEKCFKSFARADALLRHSNSPYGCQQNIFQYKNSNDHTNTNNNNNSNSNSITIIQHGVSSTLSQNSTTESLNTQRTKNHSSTNSTASSLVVPAPREIVTPVSPSTTTTKPVSTKKSKSKNDNNFDYFHTFRKSSVTKSNDNDITNTTIENHDSINQNDDIPRVLNSASSSASIYDSSNGTAFNLSQASDLQRNRRNSINEHFKSSLNKIIASDDLTKNLKNLRSMLSSVNNPPELNDDLPFPPPPPGVPGYTAPPFNLHDTQQQSIYPLQSLQLQEQ